MKNIQTDESAQKRRFEDACRKMGLIPVSRETTPWGEILIADSVVVRSDGFYQTAWCVRRKGLDFGETLPIEPGVGHNDEQKARVNLALQRAGAWIDLSKTTGLYDA